MAEIPPVEGENEDDPKSEFSREVTRLHLVSSDSIRLEAVHRQRPSRRSSAGFLRRLFLPKNVRALLAGCRKLVAEETEEAVRCFEKAAELPDAAFALGFLAIREGRFEDAEEHLLKAAEEGEDLGYLLEEHGVTMAVHLPSGAHSSLHLEPSLRGALIGLIHIYMKQNRDSDAALMRLKLRQEAMPDAHGDTTGLGR